MLQSAKTNEQKELVTELVTNLIRINPRSANTEDSLLHLSISKLNTLRSGYFTNEEVIVSIILYFKIFVK